MSIKSLHTWGLGYCPRTGYLASQVLVRKRIGCLGDSSSGGGGFHCNRGPPNIGYRYG